MAFTEVITQGLCHILCADPEMLTVSHTGVPELLC